MQKFLRGKSVYKWVKIQIFYGCDLEIPQEGIAVEKTSGRKYVVISQQRFPWDPTWNYQQSEYGDYQIEMMDVQSIPVTSKSKHFLRSWRAS